MYIDSKFTHRRHTGVDTGGYYFETDPDPFAMVIRVELFIHKLCRQKTPVIVVHAWVTMQCQFVLGLWVNSSTLYNYHGNWVWVGFEIIPPGPRLSLKFINFVPEWAPQIAFPMQECPPCLRHGHINEIIITGVNPGGWGMYRPPPHFLGWGMTCTNIPPTL